MTGEKKIIGLWREPATDTVADSAATTAAPAGGDEVAAGSAPLVARGDSASEPEAVPLPVWEQSHDDIDAMLESGTSGRWLAGTLIVAGLGWTIFALWSATGGFARLPALADWPQLIATIAMPLALLGLIWIAGLRASKSEQYRFARLARQVRDENEALTATLAALGRHLSDAQRQLQEQASELQQLGIDAAARLHDSSGQLRASADGVSAAQQQLAQSGTVAAQRLEGLIASLPRVDAVASRLADNFREAGLVAHQNGASLEAKLASLSDIASRSSQDVEAAGQTIAASAQQIEAAQQSAVAGLIARNQQLSDDIDARWTAMTERADAARERIHSDLIGAADTLDERLASVADVSTRIGQQLEQHGAASDALLGQMRDQAAALEDQLRQLDEAARERGTAIAGALNAVSANLSAFGDGTRAGLDGADALLSKSDALLTALDAVTREMDETVPLALARVDQHSAATRTLLSALRPEVDAAELVAQSTLSQLRDAEALVDATAAKLAALRDGQVQATETLTASAQQAQHSVSELRAEADAFAARSSAEMIAALQRVQEAAVEAGQQARASLDTVVADASEAMRAKATDAIDRALQGEIAAQLTAIGDASERAVNAANQAADRLMRQLITIMDTSAAVEKRVAKADVAIAASDHDTLAKQVGLLTESLKSTAIDLTKILSHEVSDTAWEAYLRGDRGVFSRRAVKLVENAEAKEILKLYNGDTDFQASVNRYIHDFEAILRTLLSARDGSAISVTLLSSDIGKLYVALAQAIDRLRN